MILFDSFQSHYCGQAGLDTPWVIFKIFEVSGQQTVTKCSLVELKSLG